MRDRRAETTGVIQLWSVGQVMLQEAQGTGKAQGIGKAQGGGGEIAWHYSHTALVGALCQGIIDSLPICMHRTICRHAAAGPVLHLWPEQQNRGRSVVLLRSLLCLLCWILIYNLLLNTGF